MKNLKQNQYPIEIENDSKTIKDIKLIIAKTYGFDSDTLKLLFNGAVLNDSKLISEYHIQEGNVLIMMMTKIKPVNQPPQQTQPQTDPQSNKDNTKKEPEQKKTKTEKKPKIEKKKEPEKDYSNSSELKSLMEMGFEKEQSILALKAAEGSVQIAIEYLYNGIPERFLNIEPELEQPEEIEEDQEEPDDKQELRAAASVVKILYSQDPSSLEDLLRNIQQYDPRIMELITQNEEEFQNLLKEPVNEEDLQNFEDFQRQLGISSQQGSPSYGDEYSTIQLTPEEAEAIQRLKSLCGLSDAEVTQAYLACDKNEELTANFLLESLYGNLHNLSSNNGNNNNNNNTTSNNNNTSNNNTNNNNTSNNNNTNNNSNNNNNSQGNN